MMPSPRDVRCSLAHTDGAAAAAEGYVPRRTDRTVGRGQHQLFKWRGNPFSKFPGSGLPDIVVMRVIQGQRI
jgi:hypothetical protein